MKDNKTFKAFRNTLNESEYSEVLTGYGNRSAHKDGAGLHHLQSAGALAGINAMLATIGKGTYLDPNEAFLKIKVSLNVVQLDFPWTPRSWDGGVGSFDIPVVQFGRVDGYDAQTGEIRFDGKANPTGGYTELNLHVDVELTPESLYVVTAKLTPSVAVAENVESVKEETEIDEDYQTPARERELARKIEKHEDIAQRGYSARMTKTGKAAKRGEKLETKHDAASVRLLKRSRKEEESPRTYGRGGKLVKRGSRAEVKEEAEQIDELSKGTKDAYVAKRGSQLSSMLSGHKHSKQLTGPQQANAVKGIKRATGVKEEVEVSEEWKSLKKTKADLNAIRASGKTVSVQHGEGDTLYRVSKPKKSVKEEAEQIDEAGQAKLERLGKAYDKARIGSRGVLNPENKKRLGDAYFKMRDKVLDKRKKRIEKGTFNKEAEVKAVVAKNRGTFSKVFGKKTVKEELVGGQKKLDLNKNKRLDSQDFALLRAKKKKPMAEAKMKQWTPRLDKLVDNRDAVRSKPKKTILTQKVQDGKKVGSARPIRKYEG
jgi:hypothetical protein